MGPGSEPDFEPVKPPTIEELKKSGSYPFSQRDPGDETDRDPWDAAKQVFGTPYEFAKAMAKPGSGAVRHFDTGATRNRDEEQLDYHGFLSPLVRKRFAEYMHEHRVQADGSLRASDNWQKGIPVESYCSSLVRHTTDAELHQDGFPHEAREDLQTALCAVIFNAQGWLYELLKGELGV